MSTNPTAPVRPTASVRVESRVIPYDALEGIRAASKKTGIGFRFLLAEAQRESAFQSDARHGVTSAAGLFQFTSRTWLELMKRHGPEHGMGDLAARITTDSRGRYDVADPQERKAILDLRRNGKISAIMAAEFAKDNRTHLERKLDRPITDGDLYIAHFLGPGGAAALLKAKEVNPDQPAADLMPGAASHNRTIFFDGASGAPRSVAEVTRLLNDGIGRTMTRFAGIDSRPETPPVPPQRPVVFAAVDPSAAPPPVSPAGVLHYTVLAQGEMPPRLDLPESEAPGSEAKAPVADGGIGDGIMRVTEVEYIESRHAYSMAMPLAPDEAPREEPRFVSGPNRVETMIDHIFNSIFDRRTKEG